MSKTIMVCQILGQATFTCRCQSNQGWLRYMVERNEEVYDNFGFDGFQIDQLGYRGTVYDANRHEVDLPSL